MSPDQVTRRIMESLVASVLLVLALPLIVVGAACSLLTYRAFPFFVHDRIGLHGRRFRFVKVRTLPPTTNRYADKYSIGQDDLPPLMQLVRKLHLDELPQLLHVARGQMSFVGPRPEMPMLHGALPPGFASQRVSVMPGLTCLWQISPHCNGLIGERTEYDRLYVEHRSGALDFWIMTRTLRKMTTGRTSCLHEVPRWAYRPEPVQVLVLPGAGAPATPAQLPEVAVEAQPELAFATTD